MDDSTPADVGVPPGTMTTLPPFTAVPPPEIHTPISEQPVFAELGKIHVGSASGVQTSEFIVVILFAVVGIAGATVLAAMTKVSAQQWLDFTKWLLGMLSAGYSVSRGLTKLGQGTRPPDS